MESGEFTNPSSISEQYFVIEYCCLWTLGSKTFHFHFAWFCLISILLVRTSDWVLSESVVFLEHCSMTQQCTHDVRHVCNLIWIRKNIRQNRSVIFFLFLIKSIWKWLNGTKSYIGRHTIVCRIDEVSEHLIFTFDQLIDSI